MNNKNMAKRFLVLFLALTVLVAYTPAAFAEQSTGKNTSQTQETKETEAVSEKDSADTDINKEPKKRLP